MKRYTGFGTGPCQGKSCLALVVRELLRLGATPAELAPFTVRPPVQPVALGALAALEPDGAAARRRRPARARPHPSPGRAPDPGAAPAPAPTS